MSDQKIGEFLTDLDFEGLCATIDYQVESIVSQSLFKNETGMASLFAFDQEQSISEHTTPYDAVVHVLEGQADIIIDGGSNIVTAGEKIEMPANHPHAVRAPERFKMLLVMVKK